MGLFRKRKPSEQATLTKAMPVNRPRGPQSTSPSELAVCTPPTPPASTKTAEQLELEIARKNSQIRELQDQNHVWQEVAARTAQPDFPPGLTPRSSSMSTNSPLPNREGPQNHGQLQPQHDYAPEVVEQAIMLAHWNARGSPVFSHDTTTSIPPQTPDLVTTQTQTFLGPSITKIANAIQLLVESRPDAGLAILISVTALCLASIYVLYSIIYTHMGYVLIGFLAVAATYSAGRYLLIIKQTELQVKQEQVLIMREEVQQEWIRSIGSKLQPQIPASPWDQAAAGGRRALMAGEEARFEELVD